MRLVNKAYFYAGEELIRTVRVANHLMRHSCVCVRTNVCVYTCTLSVYLGLRPVPSFVYVALAKEAMRFTDAYAGGAVCAPSRCSLVRHNDIMVHAF